MDLRTYNHLVTGSQRDHSGQSPQNYDEGSSPRIEILSLWLHAQGLTLMHRTLNELINLLPIFFKLTVGEFFFCFGPRPLDHSSMYPIQFRSSIFRTFAQHGTSSFFAKTARRHKQRNGNERKIR